MSQPTGVTRCCPGCGADNPPYATFCHDCGEPLTAAAGAAHPGTAARERVRARRWEVWIGVALVLVVLSYAVFDWWHREEQARQYHAGDAAVAARHWDAAVTAFSALGTYRDAPRHAANATAQVQARDRAYQTGLTAAEHANWITAYQAFSQTLAIEPDYRDTPTRFAAAAQAIPHAALAGTIYRRVSGGPPGLYLWRATGGDERLPGSDEHSLVRSYGTTAGPLVYDAPIPGATPAPAAPFADDIYNIPPLTADRQLLLVDTTAIEAGTPITPTVLPAALARAGLLLAGAGVLWSPAGNSAPPMFVPGYVEGTVVDKAYVYDLASGEGRDLTYPGAEGYILLDIGSATARPRWVQGDYRQAHHPPYQTTLYVFGDSEVRLQPVAQVAGVVYGAQLSPDGNYLVYKVISGEDGQPGTHLDLNLIDLRNPAHPVRTIVSAMLSAGESSATLQSQIVPGTGALRVLIRHVYTADGAVGRVQLDLWSLADGTTRLLWEGPFGRLRAGQGYTGEAYWLAPDGQSLTLTVPEGDGTAHLLWQWLDSSAPARELALPRDNGNTVQWWQPIFPGALLPGPYLFYYLVDRHSVDGNGEDTLIYGVAAQDPTQPPALLYEYTAATGGATGLALLPSQVVAFSAADQSIQLGTLDGSLKLPALPGIDLILPRTTTWLYPSVLYPWGY
jgi:hypothetical protein